MTGSQGEDGPSTSTLQSCYLAFSRFDEVLTARSLLMVLTHTQAAGAFAFSHIWCTNSHTYFKGPSALTIK
jgi:hypothetical protein